MIHRCITCGRTVNGLDAGLTKKLINRGAEKYFCIKCLAEKLSVTEESLKEKAAFFKKNGCTLF